MAAPTDPNKILIKNSIYPKGLTTQRIYDYYISKKNDIINAANGKPILLFMKLTEDKPEVVKRKHVGKEMILTEESFDLYVNGHVISISYEPNYKKIEKLIIDIDPKNDKIKHGDLIKCIKEDLNNFDTSKLFKNKEEKLNKRIYVSRKGFHIIYEVSQYNLVGGDNIDTVRNNLKDSLVKQFGHKYLINYKKETKDFDKPTREINLDLSSMSHRGSITVPYSLTRDGTIYTELHSLNNFNIRSTYL